MHNIQSLFKGSKLIETLENYKLAEEITSPAPYYETTGNYLFLDDEEFWIEVIADPSKYWGQKIDLYYFVVSDWIARVPGLYWSKASQIMRQHTNEDIAIQSEKWVEFNPPGKSKKVLGGVGTLLLPPSENGTVLMSITTGCNASSGIPVLFFPQVIHQLRIKQGDRVRIHGARWQSMDIQWATNFASTKDIPRGYLVIDSIDKITVLNGNYPIVYHPFSLMEYEYQDTLLYDFVYVSADSAVQNVNSKIEQFFHDYARKEGRNGEYLLNPNIIQPIFESRYSNPSELTHPSEKAKLDLLYARIRGTHFKGKAIEELIIKLPQFYQSSTSIRTLARNIGFNVSLLTEDSANSMSAQLINKCIEKGIVENLIDRIVFEYPQIFN